MDPLEELRQLADQLIQLYKKSEREEISTPFDALTRAANEVGKSFSGSWLGYHSCVYYDNLQPPPPGAHFSQEWGLKGDSWIGLGSTGDWFEYNTDQIREHILQKANNPNLEYIQHEVDQINSQFDRHKSDFTSIITSQDSSTHDTFLSSLVEQAKKIGPIPAHTAIDSMRPRKQVMTRDATALGQGFRVPPHLSILASVLSMRSTFNACKALSELSEKAISHLERTAKHIDKMRRIGTNVFIGHGRSGAWRELKDFLQDRLNLPWDEFNRIPIAGITNITRLSEMLDAAAIAFLVMTSEDELADGNTQARMNVIHEAGLFQGRLGFARAIVLLEDGCLEFSNIAGLGQIRFPPGNISATFEDVRQVLEREGILFNN